jgi:hypothetical protein
MYLSAKRQEKQGRMERDERMWVARASWSGGVFGGHEIVGWMGAATDDGRNKLQEPDQQHTKAGERVVRPSRDPRGD